MAIEITARYVPEVIDPPLINHFLVLVYNKETKDWELCYEEDFTRDETKANEAAHEASVEDNTIAVVVRLCEI